ncbi:MAG: plastocyanin/azurin family copper-binding protein [Thermoanaerobaculia bacterium]
MRKILVSVGVLGILSCGVAFSENVTLPAAASIVGGAPFFSDVRAFNTSYTAPLQVTAMYRCFIPNPCTGVGTQVFPFTLAPRESRAFDDMVQNTFHAPNTAGGVEFVFTGASGQLVVTSRLFSTQPEPTVGMFIPGLDNSQAHPTTVLTSIRNGGSGAGFRTNVGMFNQEDTPATVTFTIFDGGSQVGNPVTVNVGGHSGVQVNGIFNVASASPPATENAVIVVSANHDVFSYAAVIDNHTTDPIFVRGAQDTTSVGVPVTRIVNVGQGGLLFTDVQSGTSTSTINVGDTVTWSWSGTMSHGVEAGTCMGGGGGGYLVDGYGTCNPSGAFSSGVHQGPFEFSKTFTAAGDFPYYCTVHQSAMRGRVIVNAPAGAARASKDDQTP